MTRRVQSDEDRVAVRAIRDTLRDCGIEADVWPPYEAPIPVWYRTVVCGEPDEGRWPFELELTADGCDITDRRDEELAGSIGGVQADRRVAECVALALEVVAR